MLRLAVQQVGLRERGTHQLVAQAHELVDVELVVREEHEVLEVLGCGAGVVAQPVQRIVDAGGSEQRQRLWVAARGLVCAIGDAVVHRGQVGQVEQVAQQQAARRVERAFDVVMLGKREMHRDPLVGHAHLERHAVVLQQQLKLLQVVVPEQIGPRQRGLVGARPGDKAIGQPRVGPSDRFSAYPDEWIAGAHMLGGVVPGHEFVQPFPKVGHALLVDQDRV
jgi:hypothetical protein